MKTIFTEKHKLRDAKTELFGGQLVVPFERPSRVEYVISRIKDVSLGEILGPKDFGMQPILNIHDAEFVAFLQVAWADWLKLGYDGEAIPTCWPARRMSNKRPTDIEGRLGYYALAAETSFSDKTWEAAYASAQVSLTGAQLLLDGENGAFALCRPPGHHAAYDMYGGYCFLNNAAIAAQFLRDNGSERIAIVDVDFHHGNGTQDIFYKRGDVFFLSLHGDPNDAFPHFLGHADEAGEGAGKGYTKNYPMKRGTKFSEWRAALLDALSKVQEYGPDQLIISLGVDTFEADPISFFKLASDDFTTIGQEIARIGLPTLFVMEGGYDIEEIGINAVNVLQGFDAG